MAIVWDAQQNKYVVQSDNQNQPSGQAADSSSQTPHWDASQNKFVVGGDTTPQPQKNDIGSIVGDFIKNIINSAGQEKDKAVSEFKKNPVGNLIGMGKDVVKGVVKGGVEMAGNLAEAQAKTPSLMGMLNLDPSKAIAEKAQQGATEIVNDPALKEETTVGKDVLSPVAQFVAPSLAVPEAEGAGLLGKIGTFALQSQLIYNPDENTKNELQGRFGNLLSNIVPYGIFETVAKPIFSKMTSAIFNAGDKAVETALKAPSEEVTKAVNDTTSKGFQITNQDILDTVTGKKTPTNEFRMFVTTIGDNYSKYIRENAVKYPDSVFSGEIPEASKPIIGEMLKIPSMTDTSLVEDAKNYLGSLATKAAYGEQMPKEEAAVIKMLTDEMGKRNIPQAAEKVAEYLSKMTDYIRKTDDHNIAVVATNVKQSLVDRVEALGIPELAKVKGKLALMAKQTDDAEKILQKTFGKQWDSYMGILRDAGLVKDEVSFVDFVKNYPNKSDLKVPKFNAEEPTLDIKVSEPGKLESPLMRIVRQPSSMDSPSVTGQLIAGETGKTVKQINESTIETVLDKEQPIDAGDATIKEAQDTAKAEEIYKILEKEGKPSFKAFQTIKKAFVEPIQTFKAVISKLQPEFAVADEAKNVIQQEFQNIPHDFLTFLKQKSGYMDMTFSAMEDFFGKYSEVQRMGFLAFAQSADKPELKSTMPTGQLITDLLGKGGKKEIGGTAKSLEGLLVKNTPEVLRDPQLLSAIRGGFDDVFKMIETLPERFQTKYVDDYFRTIWEKGDSATIDNLTKQWSTLITSTGFRKEKYWDYVVEGLAAGAKLKVTNPIAMLKNEVESVLTLKALANTEERLLSMNAVVDNMKMDIKFAAPTAEAPKDFISSGIKGLEHLSFDPQVANLINSLYSPANIKSGRIGGALYNLALVQRGIQLVLPTYHFAVMTALSMHDTAGLSPINLLNPIKRTLQFGQVKKDWEAGMGDAFTKLYDEYIKVGGETMMKNRSYEQEGVESLSRGIVTAFNKVAEKSGFLKPVVNAGAGLMELPSKLSEAIFESYIPAQKFGSYAMWVDKWTAKLGRDLTVDEKRSLIMKLQNPYGEMNESLFGRSRTTQQALRLVFRAPGFREGNFRFIFDTLNIKDPMNEVERRMVLNGIAMTATMGVLGTLAFTGKLPEIKKAEDWYDLFTVNTGIKNAAGNDVVIDLPRLFNLRDYFNILGNMVTARPDIALRDLGSTTYSALSPNVTEAQTGLDIIQGKQPTDYSGRPTSSVAALFGDVKPIPLSSAQQAAQSGVSPTLQFLAGAGVPVTTTVSTKDAGKLRSQIYNLNQQRNSISGQFKKANVKDKISLRKQLNDIDKQVADSVSQLADLTGQAKSLINKKYRISREVKAKEK